MSAEKDPAAALAEQMLTPEQVAAAVEAAPLGAALGDPDPGNAVAVGYVCGNQVAYIWFIAMMELVGWDFAHHARVLRGGHIGIRFGSDGLAEARNRAVVEFLREGKGDWLFWTDTDMGFAPDTVDRLLEVADPESRPVVGALCFAQLERHPDGLGGWRCVATPTVYDWANVPYVDGDGQTHTQQGFTVRWDYPAAAVTPVAGTGAGCVLVHRSVFEKMEKEYGRVWYDRVPNTTTGQLISEDLSFCLRAGALGVPMAVHTGVRTTHLKSVWLSEEDYWRQRVTEPAPPVLPKADGTP